MTSILSSDKAVHIDKPQQSDSNNYLVFGPRQLTVGGNVTILLG
jgi:hypothetical protein